MQVREREELETWTDVEVIYQGRGADETRRDGGEKKELRDSSHLFSLLTRPQKCTFFGHNQGIKFHFELVAGAAVVTASRRGLSSPKPERLAGPIV